jgi:hypothetical protein
MLLVRTRPLLTRKPVMLVWSRRYLAMLALVTEAIRAWKMPLPWETADLLHPQLDLGDVSVGET